MPGGTVSFTREELVILASEEGIGRVVNGLCPGCGRVPVRRDKFFCNNCSIKYAWHAKPENAGKSYREVVKGRRQHFSVVQTRARKKRKREVLAKYGGQCLCCGESAQEFLTLDHVNRDGAAHRKEIRATKDHRRLYKWLRDNPVQAGIQILCFNCHMAKDWFGECPHVERRTATSFPWH